jgi:hypothetical protein
MMNIDDSQIYKGMKFLFLDFFYKVGVTDFEVLQILPPLTEISSSSIVRKRIQKDWFVIELLIYNWFKNPESLILLVSD